ncbi:MAG TPA: S1 RNA-binding domain-containing protein [Anaerolineales bacterium]|nr:S1 RNA-binding domain-containing protein [Anaerolineales bacterium]
METTNTASGATLEPKTKITGKVVKTTLAGALIDLGQPLPGVIHISQLSKDAVNKVEDVVNVGQEVEAWVRRVKKDRVELTMIEPLALEWREIEPGMVVKGKIVRLESYGAFIEIGAERPGMIHVSELAHGYVKTPSEVVKEGEEVEAQVLEVNRKKKQIKLSLKALQPETEESRPARKNNRRGGRSSGGTRKDMMEALKSDEPKEPELTAMQIAWQDALNRSGAEKHHKNKATVSEEQEDILNRTLKKRLPTGG